MKHNYLHIVTVCLGALLTSGCKPAENKNMVTVQGMTDALFSVISGNREVYSRAVVDRLQYQDHILEATEHYKESKGLPLPAQMLRMSAEAVVTSGAAFSYSLLSPWPINKQNGPKTDSEKAGLRSVTETGKNYYAEETLGGKKYFSAYYPDKAVAEACVTCHNGHKDSPRKDFALGDVLGGIVIRVPLDK